METRSIQADLTTVGKRVSGYAVAFNSPATISGERSKPFTEIVRPGSLRVSDGLKLLWNHDSSNVLASTRGGTLTVRQDETGLYMEAELPESAMREREAIARQDVGGMSFAFTINRQKWSDDYSVRELLDINVFEISLTGFPAYADAKVTGLRTHQRMAMELQLREKLAATPKKITGVAT